MMRFFIINLLLCQLYAITGYLHEYEITDCQDACSQYYIEPEIDGGFGTVPIIFQNSNINLDLYMNRFVEVDLGQEVTCVECMAFQVQDISLSDECEYIVDCFQDPCITYQCDANPNLECLANFCGGCYADFYDLNGDLVECTSTTEECFDFTGLDFGPCAMVLGVGLLNNECSYISGCDWTIDGVDYSDLFFDSINECDEQCSNDTICDEGYIEINNLCFHQGDIDIIQLMIDNSYQSGIDLGCQDGDNYCGSPNPFMDSADNWGWIAYDGTTILIPGNENGFVEPLELGIQQWQDGRLIALDCGVYIYCQLSGLIPEQINNLTELEHFRIEGNYFSGLIPESICDLNINYNDYLAFDLSYNRLCPPYPDCIDTDYEFWGQYDEECTEIGDINGDSLINIQDVILTVNLILNNEYNYQVDLNSDGLINVLDVIQLVNIILNN